MPRVRLFKTGSRFSSMEKEPGPAPSLEAGVGSVVLSGHAPAGCAAARLGPLSPSHGEPGGHVASIAIKRGSGRRRTVVSPILAALAPLAPCLLEWGARSGGGNAFEHDDREDTVSVFLVLVALPGDPSVEPVALFSDRDDGLGLERSVAEFDRHRRIRTQVVKPRRVLGAPALEATTNTRPSSTAYPSGTVVRRP